MISIEDWAAGFRTLPSVGIQRGGMVVGTCKKAFGGRFLFAEATLEFSPHESLVFEAGLTSELEARAIERGWLRAVCLGVLDVALVHPTTPITSFRCAIQGLQFHEVDSSALAFRLAARDATRSFLSEEKWCSF